MRMEKTYIVHTEHPVNDYRHMVIEAMSLERAVEMGERISGSEVSNAFEFSGIHAGTVFSEQFLTFLDSNVDVRH